MAKGKGGPNMKQVAGRAKKEENEAKKKAQADAQAEAAASADWQKGANQRKTSRDEAASAKADEAARKRQEKAALLAAEEAELGSGGKLKPAPKKKNAKKKTNDLSLLEDALVSAADKKAKKKKEEAARKKQQEEEAKQKKQAEKAAAEQQLDPLLANTEQMLGNAEGRSANVARMQDEGASGIDAALGSLNVTGELKSAKALYRSFEARMLPEIKQDYPGLRLTQQKEKIFNLWKKSAENPANQAPRE